MKGKFGGTVYWSPLQSGGASFRQTIIVPAQMPTYTAPKTPRGKRCRWIQLLGASLSTSWASFPPAEQVRPEASFTCTSLILLHVLQFSPLLLDAACLGGGKIQQNKQSMARTWGLMNRKVLWYSWALPLPAGLSCNNASSCLSRSSTASSFNPESSLLPSSGSSPFEAVASCCEVPSSWSACRAPSSLSFSAGSFVTICAALSITLSSLRAWLATYPRPSIPRTIRARPTADPILLCVSHLLRLADLAPEAKGLTDTTACSWCWHGQAVFQIGLISTTCPFRFAGLHCSRLNSSICAGNAELEYTSKDSLGINFHS